MLFFQNKPKKKTILVSSRLVRLQNRPNQFATIFLPNVQKRGLIHKDRLPQYSEGDGQSPEGWARDKSKIKYRSLCRMSRRRVSISLLHFIFPFSQSRCPRSPSAHHASLYPTSLLPAPSGEKRNQETHHHHCTKHRKNDATLPANIPNRNLHHRKHSHPIRRALNFLCPMLSLRHKQLAGPAEIYGTRTPYRRTGAVPDVEAEAG